MKTLRPGWASCSLLGSLSVWSWPAACLVAVTQVLLAAVLLLVEIRWRRMLMGLVERGGAGTIVGMDGSSGLSAAWMQAGHCSCRVPGGRHGTSHT